MLSSQLWEQLREHAITNKSTVNEKMWGLQLMAPVRTSVRVFNKMSGEARVTIPKLSPLAYSCERMFFLCFCHGMTF